MSILAGYCDKITLHWHTKSNEGNAYLWCESETLSFISFSRYILTRLFGILEKLANFPTPQSITSALAVCGVRWLPNRLTQYPSVISFDFDSPKINSTMLKEVDGRHHSTYHIVQSNSNMIL